MTSSGSCGCCVRRDGAEHIDEGRSPSGRQRAARGVVGMLVACGGADLALVALAGWWILWPAALAGVWFGASHIVAALTGYRGCPELGAIPSLFMRQPLVTRCTPWDRFDRLLGN